MSIEIALFLALSPALGMSSERGSGGREPLLVSAGAAFEPGIAVTEYRAGAV
jgi:hypothetical protein